MFSGAVNPESIIRDCVKESLVEVFKRHGRNESFLFNYLTNAVLSYIEEREQNLVLNMKYEEWVNVELADALKKIDEFVRKFFEAYGETWDSHVFKKDKELEALAKMLYYLYDRGIYDDGVSRYLLIKDFEGGNALNFIQKHLREGSLKVRSRFIEIAFYLARVRQRFPDITVFTSTPLVSRVFAFAEPRRLPVGRVAIEEEFLDKINLRLRSLFRAFLEILGCGVSANNYEKLLQEIIEEFFKEFRKWHEKQGIIFRFYQFQVRGIQAILEEAEKALREAKRKAVVLEAPTGTGKTEVFAISSILIILVYKLATKVAGRIGSNSPLVVVVYPRRALATDQIKRIIRYIYIYNKVLMELAEREPEFRDEMLKITLSMNYSEVRYVRELLNRLRHEIGTLSSRPKEVDLRYVKVRVYRKNNQIIVELPYVHAPDGSSWLRVKLPGDLSIHGKTARKYLKQLWWNTEPIDFIRAFKELVYEEPGDIHITLFESLRRDLLLSKAKRLFGSREVIGPLLFIVDEIHLNTGVHGARNAFLLDRVIGRMNRQVELRHGSLFVGLSATIPHAREFAAKFFGLTNEKQCRLVRVKESEVIPAGGEYFFIVVPASGTDLLSVSIQSIMVLHFDMPAYMEDGKPLKKTLAFADSLDVVARLHYYLYDALRIGRRAEPKGSYGLQDLRNPHHNVFQLTTLMDFRDDPEVVKRSLGDLSNIETLQSWLEGELWWPYVLEYDAGYRFIEVARFTGREKPEIVGKHIVVTDSALEVGVDYDDVVVIYQHGMPPTIAALIQRAGRSGRVMRGNPLVRAAVTVMLSPYLPTQAAVLEMLLRCRSLRDLLNRERLIIATSNVRVVRQSIAEAVLDYITLVSRDPNEVLYLSNFDTFEHRLLNYLNSRGLKKYLISVFRERLGKDVNDHVSETLAELRGELLKAR